MTRPHVRTQYIYVAACVIILIIFAVVILPYRHATQSEPKNIPLVNVITHTVTDPSEKPIPRTYASTATGSEPSYIDLPSINAAGYIVKVGIDQHNQVASPNNVNLAGWYVQSLQPGQSGLSIIDGHVDGKKGPGIFLHLSKLAPGDLYQVKLANGTSLTYEVQRLSTLKVADVPAVLFAHDPSITSQLNLITCYGAFDYQSGQYSERTIVISKLIRTTAS